MNKSQIKRWRSGIALAALGLLCGASLPGCQVWNAWLDMLKWKMADEPQKKQQQEEGSNVVVVSDKGGAGGGSGRPVIPAVVPRVMVHRITAPVGTFSTNEK